MLIALVGPDGAGKTTVANALAHAASETGLQFWYQHWIPATSNPPVRNVETGGAPPPKRRRRGRRRGDALLSTARLARNLVRFWLGYVRHVRPLRQRQDTLVVADRWIYNYLAQPYSVSFHGPAWLAKAGLRLAPQPDLIVLLDVPGSIASRRKQELTEREADEEMLRWRQVVAPWTNSLVLDGTRLPEEIAAEILRSCEHRLAPS